MSDSVELKGIRRRTCRNIRRSRLQSVRVRRLADRAAVPPARVYGSRLAV